MAAWGVGGNGMDDKEGTAATNRPEREGIVYEWAWMGWERDEREGVMNRTTELMVPQIDRCPCCGVELIPHVMSALLPRCPTQYEAEADYMATDSDGGLACVTLNYRCLRCGCKWAHGQFAESECTKNGEPA